MSALRVHSKSTQFRPRNSCSSESDVNDGLPPKHPAVRRPDVKRKQVAFWDTDSTDTQLSYDVSQPSSRNSWSSESDSKDQNPESPTFPIPRSSEMAETWDTKPRRQPSGHTVFRESDYNDGVPSPAKFPGIHRSSLAKQRVSWEMDLFNDVKSALFDLKIDGTLAPDDSESNPKEVALGLTNFSKRHSSLELYPSKMFAKESDHGRNLDDGNVRRIVDGILKELGPSIPERSISCSSSCSGCCSCCYGSCSNFGSWTPRPSTPAVDIPRTHPKPTLALVHGSPPWSESRESSCCCYQCVMFKHSMKFPANPSTSSWTMNSFCSQCLPPFKNDSLDSEISFDSLNPQSILSLDSLNSLTDPDSLEYSKSNISLDSLDSLDSCCNYDSLSDSKDSGFFSCSLPVIC